MTGRDDTAPAAPPVAVIVPVLNKHSFLAASLDSITVAAARGGGEVIVVDNGSTDGSLELAQGYRTAQVLQAAGTIAANRNLGAKLSTAPLLCFLDCDIVVPPDYLDRIRRVFDDPSVAATGYPVGLPTDATWLERTWHRLHELRPGAQPSYVNSGNFAVRRGAFSAVGGFDARLRTGEDTDICKRLTEAGLRVVADRSLDVAHLDNPRTIWAFFRKQVWHGQGMAQGNPLRTPCRVTIATSIYLALTLGGMTLLLTEWPWPVRAAAFLGLHLAVPVAAVVARIRRGGRAADPIRPVVLYEVYFLARAVALIQLVARVIRKGAPTPQASRLPS